MEKPEPKVTAATFGSALASICVFVVAKLVSLSDTEAVALTGSLATVFTFGAGYMKRSR